MKIALIPHRPGADRGSSTPRGFTLVEVLVAIVVLSFGVLGVVGMQVAALQSNKEARNQSVAVALGRELGDMMRSNKDVALASGTANPYLVDFSGSVPTTTSNCFTGACATPTAVAEFNVREWLKRVKAALPGARVVVCYDATPYDATTGLPQWDCPATPPANAPAVVKIGWTQKKLDSSATAVQQATGTGAARPIVVLPLIAGSTT